MSNIVPHDVPGWTVNSAAGFSLYARVDAIGCILQDHYTGRTEIYLGSDAFEKMIERRKIDHVESGSSTTDGRKELETAMAYLLEKGWEPITQEIKKLDDTADI